MLIPRFSIRFLLALTTGFGLFFVVLAAAVRGNSLAQAVSIAAAALVLWAILHVGMFAGALLLSRYWSRFHPKQGSSPFATDALPPQVLPPDQT